VFILKPKSGEEFVARKMAIVGLILAGSVAVTGCTINFGSAGDDRDGMMSQSDSSKYSSQDIMFAQMMIPHHQQAVDMGTLAETRANDPEVKALAAEIKAEQAPEIQLMKNWLNSADAGMEMGHEMAMGGMLSKDDMADLARLSGAAFDRKYVTGMIGHHEGAIAMVKMISNSENSDVKAFGERVVASQTKQIETLRAILSRLG
jgi:uncharacterized protein (DUF305 family)